MRHLKSGRKLGRNSSHRKAMFRNMVTSLVMEEQIRTTEAKAKELRSIAEKVLTLGRRVPPSSLEGLEGQALADAKAARVHAIRQARKWVTDRNALDRIFNEYSERFKDRPGGYLRLVKVGNRTGDNAPLTVVSLIPADEPLTFKEVTKPAPASAPTAPGADTEVTPEVEVAGADQEAPVEAAATAEE
jgi:large subunit ribosomal protein L17